MTRKLLWIATSAAAMFAPERSTSEARVQEIGGDSTLVVAEYQRPFGESRYSVYYRAKHGRWQWYTTTRNIGMAQRIANMLEGQGFATYIHVW
jgi:hypothetical protein